MPDDAKRIPAVFYRSAGGSEPAREWLRALPVEDRRVVGRDIATVEFGWPVGMPVCRPLSGGVWEVRSSLPSGRIARVLHCMQEGRMVLLHALVKKTQKTPPGDLALARTRKQEVEP